MLFGYTEIKLLLIYIYKLLNRYYHVHLEIRNQGILVLQWWPYRVRISLKITHQRVRKANHSRLLHKMLKRKILLIFKCIYLWRYTYDVYFSLVSVYGLIGTIKIVLYHK